MHERSFWDDCADAMELTIEGNRLIVTEIALALQDQWHAMLRWVSGAVHAMARIRHLPRA